ncbi:MAG: type II secretion system protein [Candidatus Portnoybacteria bacterium]|nr:type II secretion system protein [Candidatus Portnoybacteria bacterium]
MMKKNGFTLIEMLVTMSIFVIAMGTVAGFVITSYRSQGYILQQSSAIDEARKGIETMVKEIREAKMGDDGSYIIEKAEDYEIIFYSDIDKDGETEKIRYFIYQTSTIISEEDDCVSYNQGGSCNVDFNNFTDQPIEQAEVEICAEGDLNGGNEYVDVYADGEYLNQICRNGCGQCSNQWDGCTPFDVTTQAADGSISFMADGSSAVGSGGSGFCNWEQNNHSMKARFTFTWTETDMNENIILRKGVTQPTGYPIEYPEENEDITILSQYIRNQLPIFRYFDGDNNELDNPARLEDTKLMRVHLIINIDPLRAPEDFELESNVQIRNLKTNL